MRTPWIFILLFLSFEEVFCLMIEHNMQCNCSERKEERRQLLTVTASRNCFTLISMNSSHFAQHKLIFTLSFHWQQNKSSTMTFQEWSHLDNYSEHLTSLTSYTMLLQIFHVLMLQKPNLLVVKAVSKNFIFIKTDIAVLYYKT